MRVPAFVPDRALAQWMADQIPVVDAGAQFRCHGCDRYQRTIRAIVLNGTRRGDDVTAVVDRFKKFERDVEQDHASKPFTLLRLRRRQCASFCINCCRTLRGIDGATVMAHALRARINGDALDYPLSSHYRR